MATLPEKLRSKAAVPLVVLVIVIVRVGTFSFTNCTVSGSLNDTWRLKVLCYNKGFCTIPKPIPTNVSYLDISFNSISEIRVGDFDDLLNLRSLNLSHSNISRIQDGTVEHFPELLHLNLANNQLKSVSSGLLRGLANLQVLRLDGNAIQSFDTSAFNTLEKLRVLNLTGNNLRHIANVKPALSPPMLEELYIGRNDFDAFNSWDMSTTPLPLKTIVFSYNPLIEFQVTNNIFPNLDFLDLSYCGRNSTMPWNLTGGSFLNSVKTLNLSGVRIPEADVTAVLRDNSWASLFKLKLNELKFMNIETLLRSACSPGLGVLRMHHNGISNLTARMLEPCANLTELDFGENEISHIVTPIFKEVAPLRVLRLEINKLARVNGLFENLPMLEFIDLSRNRISSLTCSDFGNLTRMNTLYLFANRISYLPSCVFDNLTNLEVVKLGSNKLLTIGTAFKTDLPSLIVLELPFNKLSIIYKDSFTGLSGLQTLQLSDNQIYEIEAHAFSRLQNLTWLLLSSNRITAKTIQDPAVFSGVPNLISLELFSNVISYADDTLKVPPFTLLSSLEVLQIHSQRRGIGKLPSNLLHGLTSLKMFYGGNMNLKRLHPDSFNSTPRLWFLDLSKNALADADAVSAEVFHPIPKLFKLIVSRAQIHSLNFVLRAKLFRLSVLRAPENTLDVIDYMLIRSLPNLKYLDLQKNTFTCDCSNADFINWALTKNITQVIYLNTYSCSYPPSQKGKSILELNIELCHMDNDFIRFVCSSVVVTVTLLVSFVYRFLRWRLLYAYYLFVAFLYDSKRKRMHLQHGFEYDAFISYNARDEAWVVDEMLPRLEGEQGWKLCLHHRDFQPGRSIIDNIMDGIYNSRKTICLITSDYLTSTWCSQEIQMATFRLFDEKKDVLILIFLEDIPSHQLSPYHRMRQVVKKKTYLKWPKAGEDTKIFWQKLRMALETKEGPEEENALFSGQEEHKWP